MIATLTGIVAEKLPEYLIIDVGGVGYGVYMTAEDFGRLAVGDKAKVYTYNHIRETAHDLFAFCHIDTKRLFEQLLNVNGVGPKMALNMLSIGSTEDVRRAIATGDVKFLQSASGVGKRVAERVVVELKDKVGVSGADLTMAGSLLQADGVLLQDEAVQALVALGYSPHDASQALQAIDPSLSTPQRVTQALKGVRS